MKNDFQNSKSKQMHLEIPFNNVGVTVKTKYNKNISKVMALSAIQNGASVDPTDIVQIVADVVALPKKITTERKDYEGYSSVDLEIGDIVIMSYRVISDRMATETDEPKYRNRMWVNAQEIFMADIRNVFAVIRGGEIIMLNGWVMCDDITESKIILPAHMKRIKQAAKSKVLYIGLPKENEKPVDVFQGDTVYFNPFIAQRYEINDKKFVIIKQSHIFGKNLAD